jgi:hypothetical protein
MQRREGAKESYFNHRVHGSHGREHGRFHANRSVAKIPTGASGDAKSQRNLILTTEYTGCTERTRKVSRKSKRSEVPDRSVGSRKDAKKSYFNHGVHGLHGNEVPKLSERV